MSERERPPRLQVGGSIREDALYIERQADRDLLAALRAGEICYVFAPRQMGKSSLCSRTARRLRQDGIRCILLDLNLLGGQKSVPNIDAWFLALIKELARQLGLPREFIDTFWRPDDHTPGTYKWSRFLQEALPQHIRAPLVLIFDEVDTTLSLPFICDDFFAVMRACYNARSEHPELARLSFCFVGVASPGDLVTDPARTPFNLGANILLEDFSEAEGQAFLPTLPDSLSHREAWLQAVFAWTGGHPYMTHKLFDEIARRPRNAAVPAADVEERVRKLFLTDGRHKDLNLQYAEKRIASRPNTGPLLRLYRRILERESVFADRNDPLQNELRLAGLCRWQGDAMVTRNTIFATVYDWAWVRNREAERHLDEAMEKWLSSGKPTELVLRGAQLDLAKSWALGRNDLSSEEQEFLLASMEAARADASRRALKTTIGSLTAALILSVIFSIWQIRTLQSQNEVARQLVNLARDNEQIQRRSKEELALRLHEEQARREESEKRVAQEKQFRLELDRRLAEMNAVIEQADQCTKRALRDRGLIERQSQRSISDWQRKQDAWEKSFGRER